MYGERTIEALLNEAFMVKDFIVTTDMNEKELIDLATALQEKKEIKDIYWLDGSSTNNYPSFDSIRLKPRWIIVNGQMRTETDGLIFPQSEPIILVIQNFSALKEEDKNKYVGAICKKEEQDYYPHIYLHEESIVIIGLNKGAEEPKFSYKVNVRKLI
jgi:hypothetical protein